MLTIMQGDLFQASGTWTIPVNLYGAMGRGIALQCKNYYPEAYRQYKLWCGDQTLALGKPAFYKLQSGQSFLFFATKNDWRSQSKLLYLQVSLCALLDHPETIPNWVTQLAVPLLGTGYGGLDVEPVFDLLVTSLQRLSVPTALILTDADAIVLRDRIAQFEQAHYLQ
jgi:hypothetical protein